MRAISRRRPGTEYLGIAGTQMRAAGCESLYPIERLSVMGLIEVLPRYVELLPARRRIARDLLSDPPDVLVGIDAPDFNLGLERRVRAAGIPTVHYVSPSVWAWRRYRLAKIARSVDLMLTLFPFEAAFYRAHDIAVEFVGHPLADMISPDCSQPQARRELGMEPEAEVVALLPGSRVSEVRFLAEPLVRTAAWLRERRPGVEFVVPLVSAETRALFESALRMHGAGLEVRLIEQRSRTCMAAADAVLLASGTATLEAMLLNKPMVITYRSTALTYRIMESWVGRNVRFAGLPNLLAERLLVPELMQRQAAAQWLGPAVLAALEEPTAFAEVRETFAALHRQLRRGASERAAEAIVALIEARGRG